MKKVSLVLVSAVLATTLAAGYGGGKGGQNKYGFGSSNQNMITSTQFYEQSAQQKADLLFMWEEEKMAKDVYLKMYELWGEGVFQNIANSEQRHQNQMAALLDKYNLEYPTNLGVGVFQNSQLQELYNTLTSKGALSLDEAWGVGILIEEKDIADLQESILSATEDVKTVYENLLQASYKHLAAFQNARDGIVIQQNQAFTDCNSQAMANALENGWNLVGTSYSGCSISGLKAKGAKAVFRYKGGSAGWVDDDTINAGEGFWIYK